MRGPKKIGRLLETSGKESARKILAAVLPVQRAGTRPASVRRILAIRPDARLGNVLLLTPALRALKNYFPDAEIDVLMPGLYADALLFNPCVTRVISPLAFAASLKNIPEIAVDFSSYHAFSLSSAAYSALSRAPFRVGYDRGDAPRFLNALLAPPAERRHETANLEALSRRAAEDDAARAAPSRPEWHFGAGEQLSGARDWKDFGLDAESVAIFIGARDQKRLAIESFVELSRLIAGLGRKTIFFGGPAEGEFLKKSALPREAFIAPPLVLRRFAAVIANARAVVTADTGPMHLAAALGLPSVELFSHTEPWRFGYAHLPGNVVVDTPNRLATVAEIFDALQSALGASKR